MADICAGQPVEQAYDQVVVVEAAARVLLVEPRTDGAWAVRLDGDEPISLHASASEAELAARDRARSMHIETIMLRDSYDRVRRLPVPRRSPGGGRFRA